MIIAVELTAPSPYTASVARRSRSSFNPVWLLAGAAALIVIFGVGSLLLNQTSTPFRTADPLEISAYLENSNSLRGNVYRVEG